MVKRLVAKAKSAAKQLHLGGLGVCPQLKFSCSERPYLSDFQPKNSVSVYSYNLQLITADN